MTTLSSVRSMSSPFLELSDYEMPTTGWRGIPAKTLWKIDFIVKHSYIDSCIQHAYVCCSPLTVYAFCSFEHSFHSIPIPVGGIINQTAFAFVGL